MSQFTAEIKKHDPDHEEEASFATRKEAEQWLLDQQRFGFFTMRINNERVRIVDGHVVPDSNPRGNILGNLDRMNEDFDRRFRPQPSRGNAPANPATLIVKGDL